MIKVNKTGLDTQFAAYSFSSYKAAALNKYMIHKSFILSTQK